MHRLKCHIKLVAFLLFYLSICINSFAIDVNNNSTSTNADINEQLIKAHLLSASDNIDDIKKAIEIYTSLANKGISDSYGPLAYYYSTGKIKDINKSIYYYTKDAEYGNKYSASILAGYYDTDIFGKKNYSLAIKWYEKSIELGKKDDLLKLGEMYQNGHGVNANFDKAMSLYKEARSFEIDDSQKYIDELEKIISTRNMLYGKAFNRIVNASFFDYLAILSTILAIIFYFRGKKEKILRYDIKSFSLITNNINKFDLLNIEYDGHKIDNLTVSRFAVWNSGKEPIRHADIAKSSPISIKVEDGIILKCNLIAQSNPSNMFTYSISNNKDSVVLDFDFIDYDNTAIVEILHTNTDVAINGCVIGGKEIKKSSFPKLPQHIRRNAIIGLFLVSILFVICDIAVINYYRNMPEYGQESIVLFFVIILSLTLLSLLFIFSFLSLLQSKPMSGFNLEN